MNILVTGATGFVGTFLCDRLLADGHNIRGTLRSPERIRGLINGVEPTIIGSIGPDTDWSSALAGIEVIIHLAARVHIMNDCADDSLSEFRQVNVAGAMKLAREAANIGVKRFVFVSTIKVNGEEANIPYNELSSEHPLEPYGVSKLEAELSLQQIAKDSNLEMVIVRPALVYGPGVKANFLSMVRIINRKIPLPLASIINKRSFIYVGNLVDALAVCAFHPRAAGKKYLISDSEVVSTPELIRRVGEALGAPVWLFPFPVSIMRIVGMLTGKSATVRRLTESFAIDSSTIRKELGWQQPFTMQYGLQITAQWFKRAIDGN